MPAGIGIEAAASLALMLHLPLVAATLAVVIVSLGYDMTQPLLAGIVTSLGGKQLSGQAMGLDVFTLFTGMESEAICLVKRSDWASAPR